MGGEECCLPVVESVGIQEGSDVWQALQRQLPELLLPHLELSEKRRAEVKEESYLKDQKMVALPADPSRQT